MTRFLTALILCFTSLTACGQPETSLTETQIYAIDNILNMDVPDGAPGLAIGIVREGAIIYERYAGFANLEDSTKIDAHSRFNIASNGKQFTALAILHLIEQDLLNLDTDIRIFLPKLFVEVQDQITIKHLLNHTSGIRDFYDIWSMQGKRWWQFSSNNQDVLALLEKQRELNFIPGSQYLYSNANYVLLAEIISKVSGQSFIDYTLGIFQELGMENTSFEPDHNQISEPVAQPYFNFDTWTTYKWINDIVGDGALFSTLSDQLQWELIIQTRDSYPIITGIIEKSQEPIPDSEFANYGYGVEFDEFRNESLTFHAGATGAWKAMTYRFPDKKLAIVVLTNSGKVLPSLTVQAVSDVLLGITNNEVAYSLAPDVIGGRVEIDEILGTYQNANGFTFRFVERDGTLYLLRDGRNDIELVRESANVFHQWNDPTFKQEFTRTQENLMQVTAYHTSHAPYTLTRIEADFSNFAFASLEGTFLNIETDVSIKVEYVEGDNYLVNIAGQKYSGQLLKPTMLKAGNYLIHFDPSNHGIEELKLDGNRIRNVSFRRK